MSTADKDHQQPRRRARRRRWRLPKVLEDLLFTPIGRVVLGLAALGMLTFYFGIDVFKTWFPVAKDEVGVRVSLTVFVCAAVAAGLAALRVFRNLKAEDLRMPIELGQWIFAILAILTGWLVSTTVFR